jgi:hypothetical protein
MALLHWQTSTFLLDFLTDWQSRPFNVALWQENHPDNGQIGGSEDAS